MTACLLRLPYYFTTPCLRCRYVSRTAARLNVTHCHAWRLAAGRRGCAVRLSMAAYAHATYCLVTQRAYHPLPPTPRASPTITLPALPCVTCAIPTVYRLSHLLPAGFVGSSILLAPRQPTGWMGCVLHTLHCDARRYWLPWLFTSNALPTAPS